jgi:hypothetical protein
MKIHPPQSPSTVCAEAEHPGSIVAYLANPPISRSANEWLDDLFADRRTYEWDDFARLYRTNLNIGQPMDDTVQECATLSRLIYGLSSCYLAPLPPIVILR